MIKESRNQSITRYYVYSIEEIYFCLVQKSINLSFPLIWQYAPDQQKAHMTSLSKLGCGWPRLATPNQKYELHS